MPIEMPRGLPFSVDTWSQSSKRKRHHFLTHAHKDHSIGILTHASYPIYSTHLTKSLVLQQFPQMEDSLFVGIEVGQSVVVDDPYGEFTVTAFDANHCPGAVMFLFEGKFGNILHTGDCRLTPECLQYLPEKYISKKGKQPRCELDYVFLDCTFGKFPQKLPSKHSAIRQVVNCIWKHPAAAVIYLTCDLLGQEDILVTVSQTFGSKIFVDKAANPGCFLALTLIAPEILTQDPSSRFHLLDGFPKLYERAAAKLSEAQTSNQPEPLIIRPSAQWYACEEEPSDSESRRKLRFSEAIRDPFGVWHVCYSMHSSREELEWALQLLMPKWVVSTTPSCRAIELDYVKKNCSGTRLTYDDPLWRLLDISVEASSGADTAIGGAKHSPVIGGSVQISTGSQLQPITVSSSQFSSLSSPTQRPTVTLFGRARLGIEGFSFPHHDNIPGTENLLQKPVTRKINNDEAVLFEADVQVTCAKKTLCTKGKSPKAVAGKINQDEIVPLEAVTCEDRLEIKLDSNAISEQSDNLAKKETRKVSSLPIGSSKCFGENVRRLYRSMNVPVPRPLPSLVELMGANKGTKKKFEF